MLKHTAAQMPHAKQWAQPLLLCPFEKELPTYPISTISAVHTRGPWGPWWCGEDVACCIIQCCRDKRAARGRCAEAQQLQCIIQGAFAMVAVHNSNTGLSCRKWQRCANPLIRSNLIQCFCGVLHDFMSLLQTARPTEVTSHVSFCTARPQRLHGSPTDVKPLPLSL